MSGKDWNTGAEPCKHFDEGLPPNGGHFVEDTHHHALIKFVKHSKVFARVGGGDASWSQVRGFEVLDVHGQDGLDLAPDRGRKDVPVPGVVGALSMKPS